MGVSYPPSAVVKSVKLVTALTLVRCALDGYDAQMTQPTDDNVPVDEVLTPATPGAEALPSTEEDERTSNDYSSSE